jgi:hypothetical protein
MQAFLTKECKKSFEAIKNPPKRVSCWWPVLISGMICPTWNGLRISLHIHQQGSKSGAPNSNPLKRVENSDLLSC